MPAPGQETETDKLDSELKRFELVYRRKLDVVEALLDRFAAYRAQNLGWKSGEIALEVARQELSRISRKMDCARAKIVARQSNAPAPMRTYEVEGRKVDLYTHILGMADAIERKRKAPIQLVHSR